MRSGKFFIMNEAPAFRPGEVHSLGNSQTISRTFLEIFCTNTCVFVTGLFVALSKYIAPVIVSPSNAASINLVRILPPRTEIFFCAPQTASPLAYKVNSRAISSSVAARRFSTGSSDPIPT